MIHLNFSPVGGYLDHALVFHLITLKIETNSMETYKTI